MEVTLIPITAAGRELAHAATLSSVTDTSPSGSAIFSQSLDLAVNFSIPKGSRLIEPTELDELSGVDLKTQKIRKGTCPQIQSWVQEFGRTIGEETIKIVSEIELRGNQAFVLADQEQELGVIEVASIFLGRQSDTHSLTLLSSK